MNKLLKVKNVFERKPRYCRRCGGKSIATYIYGFPSEKMIEMIKTKKYASAGCCLDFSEYQRTWCCNTCGFDFYKKAKLS